MTIRATYPTFQEAIRAISTYWNNAFSTTRMIRGVDATDDVIIDTNTKGVVLRSPDGNYWRIAVSNVGALSATSLGATKP